MSAQEKSKADHSDVDEPRASETKPGDEPIKKGAGRETKVENAEAPPTDEERPAHNMVKFEVFGEEMLEKQVRPSGNSGRVYLPPEWVGRRVKVIRVR